MALADLLNVEDSAEVKNDLILAMHAMAEAAREYATAGLGAANSVLEVATSGGPMSAAYTNYAEIGKFQRLAQKAVQSTIDLRNIVAMFGETGDEMADAAYSEHLGEVTDLAPVYAMMEATSRRLHMINSALPKNPQPGARFNSSIFVTEG